MHGVRTTWNRADSGRSAADRAPQVFAVQIDQAGFTGIASRAATAAVGTAATTDVRFLLVLHAIGASGRCTLVVSPANAILAIDVASATVVRVALAAGVACATAIDAALALILNRVATSCRLAAQGAGTVVAATEAAAVRTAFAVLTVVAGAASAAAVYVGFVTVNRGVFATGNAADVQDAVNVCHDRIAVRLDVACRSLRTVIWATAPVVRGTRFIAVLDTIRASRVCTGRVFAIAVLAANRGHAVAWPIAGPARLAGVRAGDPAVGSCLIAVLDLVFARGRLTELVRADARVAIAGGEARLARSTTSLTGRGGIQVEITPAVDACLTLIPLAVSAARGNTGIDRSPAAGSSAAVVTRAIAVHIATNAGSASLSRAHQRTTAATVDPGFIAILR